MLGYAVMKRVDTSPSPSQKGYGYYQDGLYTAHNREFIEQPDFASAYARGLKAAQGVNPHHHWRVHVALWAAKQALRVKGDYVECGVNAGFMSCAIMQALNWNLLDRHFYLIDSFEGPSLTQLTEDEIESGLEEQLNRAIVNGGYVTDMQRIHLNFSDWTRAHVIQGFVPDALEKINTERVAFLHLDMNAAYPEKIALKHFWEIMEPGAVVLLDDYAYFGYRPQKSAIDEVAATLGFDLLTLPTGQGLIVK